MHISCTICQELILGEQNCFVIPCGHVYHETCLFEWLRQKKSCPQCRAGFRSQPIKVYFNIEENLNDSEFVASKIEEAVNQCEEWQKKYRDVVKELEPLKEKNERLTKRVQFYEEETQKQSTNLDYLRLRVSNLKAKNMELEAKDADLESMKKELSSLREIKSMVFDTEEEVQKSLRLYTCNEQSIKQLVTHVEILKAQSERYRVTSNKYKKQYQEEQKAKERLQEAMRKPQFRASEKTDENSEPFSRTSPQATSTPDSKEIDACVDRYTESLLDGASKNPCGSSYVSMWEGSKQKAKSRDVFQDRGKPYLKPSKLLVASQKTHSANRGNQYVYDGMGGSKSVTSIVRPTTAQERVAARIKSKVQASRAIQKPNLSAPSGVPSISTFLQSKDSEAFKRSQASSLPKRNLNETVDLSTPPQQRLRKPILDVNEIFQSDSSNSNPQFIDLDSD